MRRENKRRVASAVWILVAAIGGWAYGDQKWDRVFWVDFALIALGILALIIDFMWYNRRFSSKTLQDWLFLRKLVSIVVTALVVSAGMHYFDVLDTKWHIIVVPSVFALVYWYIRLRDPKPPWHDPD